MTGLHLGDFFYNRQEPGQPGLPVMAVTMNDSLVLRDDMERRTESGLAPEQHLLVRKGDIAYNMMRMWQGACGLAETDCIVSPAYVVLAPKPGIDSRFAYQWFKSNRMIHLFWAYSHGLTEDRLRLYFDAFAEIPATPPPLDEQQRIAAMLETWDRAIAETEHLIAAKRRRYRALIQRMERNYHDQRIEFGNLVDLISTRVQPGTGGIPSSSLELENIEEGTGRLLGSGQVTEESALRSRFLAGDTLFGKLRPYLRKFARPGFDGICSTEIWVFRAKPEALDSRLVFFLVQTLGFEAAATKQSGSKMPRADWDLVSAAPVPCPQDIEAQRELATALETALRSVWAELGRHDAILRQKHSLLQKLLSGRVRLDGKSDRQSAKPRSATGGRK